MRASEEETLMDDYLASIGLHRKRVAKDGSCLFRAVAEQVLHNQSLHAQVRAQCVRFLRQHRESYAAFIEGDFEAYLQRLQDPQHWAGEVEMNALAIMYKRDFVIFQEPGKPPVDITGDKFKEKVQLSFLNGNHYDSVYPVSHIKNAALCQSVLYELLYADVFRVSRHALPAYQAGGRACERLSDDNMATCASSDESDPDADAGNTFRSKNSWSRGRGLPWPESVRRSLSASLYRNVAYDTWQKSKKAQQKRDHCMAADMQYTVGQRCKVWLDGREQSYNATIEEIPTSGGLATVYTEEEGRLRVPLWSLASDGPGRSAVLRRERRVSDGPREGAWDKSGPKSFSGPRASAPAPSGHAHQQKSRPPQRELRRSRKSACDTASFGLTEEERLLKEEELQNVALVELQLKDEHSFPALGRGSLAEDVVARSSSAVEKQKHDTGPLQSSAACPSSPPSTDSAALSSNIGPAPTFISPIAPSPAAATAAVRSLSSPTPPADPRSSSSSPAPPLPRVTGAPGLWAPGPTQSPDAGDAASASVGQGAAEELKDQAADVRDPPQNQNHQVQSGQPPSLPIHTTPQKASENSSAHRALPGPFSDTPQPSAATSFPLGLHPTLPGGVPVHQLYQDLLYPGFPLGESGNVLPAPDFSLRKSGEDLPQDVNVLRFFFNLGVKAYNWPFYTPYMYLLPLQQAHIMQPGIVSPVQSHRPPDAAPRPAYSAAQPGHEGVNVMPPLDVDQALGRAPVPARGHKPPAPPQRPSVGCNTDDGDESSDSRAAASRYDGGRRPGGRGGYRRRRGRQPGTYRGY
ncbi:OTU domain-containing protein 4 isoform X1 [Phyllopteryx taeniolatus]|uniref:OTU domain-containing protein 4 isoform X1 n=1 Tax=Phyllopteryx taeniolatus TaxID=161469 RepID=UPI002AD4C289|nr:OTU domain-containing protein 4 isoform X1 [Phyllopteryx taeniolatus]